jgi:hypothetical protein
VGKIDEVMYFNRWRTPAELAALARQYDSSQVRADSQESA